jgi:hypothetical protein
MEDRKLSKREAELVAQARREAKMRKAGMPTTAQPTAVNPAAARPAAPAAQPPQEARTETSAERLARLMAEERAETERRKKKMRRYGIAIPGAIIALFALWVMRAPRRR